ncbi:hypothetical protein EDEG_01756 [Edhazardia aedis USNM 41457]|uniref:Pre-mRNA polyadenylation factor Fip1 domain-containing protein n=1 Tax=Edhazardia aedis (strain USNM 41457) TaxID=1003232 RepID=J9DRI8_EDHAE|nr:hypothetical protein EDEG_01756 [Edhazardia aedis USNM 41457]|eukprot:EJW03947.1 hypothetical protein EDEG_01756 [Edhazardia aedis USNM 41457]
MDSNEDQLEFEYNSKNSPESSSSSSTIIIKQNEPQAAIQYNPILTQYIPQINNTDIFDFDLNTIEEKPWLKPGADIEDYFNYGFDENSWKMYCTRQRVLRKENGKPLFGVKRDDDLGFSNFDTNVKSNIGDNKSYSYYQNYNNSGKHSNFDKQKRNQSYIHVDKDKRMYDSGKQTDKISYQKSNIDTNDSKRFKSTANDTKYNERRYNTTRQNQHANYYKNNESRRSDTQSFDRENIRRENMEQDRRRIENNMRRSDEPSYRKNDYTNKAEIYRRSDQNSRRREDQNIGLQTRSRDSLNRQNDVSRSNGRDHSRRSFSPDRRGNNDPRRDRRNSISPRRNHDSGRYRDRDRDRDYEDRKDHKGYRRNDRR